MARMPKSDFLRGVLSYNPSVYGPPGTAKEMARLRKKVEDYDAKGGGRWNYANLYSTIEMVLKGMPEEQAIGFLSSLDGPGEAKAKTELFKKLVGKISLPDAVFVDVGPCVIDLPNGLSAKVRPDFSYKQNDEIYWAFVYPNKEPALKKHQRGAIVSLLARPIPLVTERHVLLLIEFSQVAGQREFRAEEFEFDYRSTDEGFLIHMGGFYHALSERPSDGDLFA